MIEVIFFDFDGVIVESNDIKTNAFAKIFEKENGSLRKKIVNYHLNNAGVSRYEKFRYIYKNILNRFLGEKEFRALCGRFAAQVIDDVAQAPYVKGAREFLEKNVSKYICFLISATPEEEIKEIIIRRDINHFFQGIYGAPNNKRSIVKKILIKKGVEPINALYVGDAISDYEAARGNGVNFVARINNNKRLFNGINCPKIKDLTDLEMIVETI